MKKKASRHRANSDSFIHEAKKTLDLSARSVTSKKSKEARFPVGLVREQEQKETCVPEQELEVKEESKKSPSKRHSDS